MKRIQRILILFALISIYSVIIPPTPVNADMGIGPPLMRFSIEYQIPRTPIVDLDLLLCEDFECENHEIYETIDHFSYVLPCFYCGGEDDSEWCTAGMGDSDFVKYHKISIKFDDGVTRISNIFRKRGYTSHYIVSVNEHDLTVREDGDKNAKFYNYLGPYTLICFFVAVILTVIAEVKTARFYSKKIEKTIRFIVLANLITLPIVWFILPNYAVFFHIGFIWVFILVELFAIAFEALFLFITNRKSRITLKEGVIVSLFINFTSVGFGLIILGLIILTTNILARL